MLIIQTVTLFWTKKFRGAPYSTSRNQMEPAYSIPADYNSNPLFPFKNHCIVFEQEKDKINLKMGKIRTIDKKMPFNIENVWLEPEASGYKVIFKYTPNVGQPNRTFEDRIFKDSFNRERDSIHNSLVEMVGLLQPNDYIRVHYNGRHTDFDTGEWYYKMQIINLLLTEGREFSADILLQKEPDIIYRQLARLY